MTIPRVPILSLLATACLLWAEYETLNKALQFGRAAGRPIVHAVAFVAMLMIINLMIWRLAGIIGSMTRANQEDRPVEARARILSLCGHLAVLIAPMAAIYCFFAFN